MRIKVKMLSRAYKIPVRVDHPEKRIFIGTPLFGKKRRVVIDDGFDWSDHERDLEDGR